MVVEDFRDREGNWVQGFLMGKSNVRTVSGSKYEGMAGRCLPGSLMQMRRPTYIGCKCDFTCFQDFANWHTEQIGYNCKWQLDKDLLTKGNKIYSKDTCILLPRCLNMFLNVRQNKVSFLPAGVCKYRLKYQTDIKVRTDRVYLGRFNTPEEAFNAYKIAKEDHARVLAEEWKSQIDPRAYQALMSYEVLITD